MAGPKHQYLYFAHDDRIGEVINGARTATYLQNVGIDGIEICSVLDLAGCPTYAWVPYAVDSADETLVGYYDPCSWVQIPFDHPVTDPAPWYNADYPESADALGFYIEEWTGLDSGHIRRSVQTRGGAASGVSFGNLGSEGRVMKLNILMLARSEDAMIYLFDWLDQMLVGSCSSCATDTLLFRRTCGTIEDPSRGVGELRRVGLVEGLAWETDIETRGRCFIRRASFTLTAGDPCIYKPSVDAEASEQDYIADPLTCLGDAYLSAGRLPCRPSCSELSVDCRTSLTIETNHVGAVAPIVTLTNSSDEYALPVRVVVYADSYGLGTAESPCGLPLLGEIYLTPLPPWSELIWDVPGRRVLYRDITTGIFVESSAFVTANDPPIQRWFTLPCGVAHIVMEPANFCLEPADVGYEWPAGGYEFTDPHYPDMEVAIGERVSCS